MKKTVLILALTLGFLVLLDVMVGATLRVAEGAGRLGSLVQYFEYGRSVPGKLDRWQDTPNTRGNLFDVAWRSSVIADSQALFQSEPDAPTIRSYGMSFVNNILKNAVDLQPGLNWDNHSGPGAPPNYTYALFAADRENRRPGDIVVLGILSSALPNMEALSNRTWAFEQPAPFTYPIYRVKDGALTTVEPLVTTPVQQRALRDDPAARQAWRDQLHKEDAFFSNRSFGARWLDISPFARLVRRSLALSHINQVKADIRAQQDQRIAPVLTVMIRDFARTAQADGQTPIVMLIQTGGPQQTDLLAMTKPVLDTYDIPYFATAEHFDPTNPAGFAPDGHYLKEVDRAFANAFLELLDR